MDPRVKVSAAEGLLRVENGSPADVKVVIGGTEGIVSPGSQKSFTLPELTEYQVIHAGGGVPVIGAGFDDPAGEEDPEATAPPAKVIMRPSDEALIGSSVQPAEFPEIMVLTTALAGSSIADVSILASALSENEKQDFRVLQLGDVVRDAFERAMVGDRKATLAEWNELEQAERERAIAETLEILREAAARAAGYQVGQ